MAGANAQFDAQAFREAIDFAMSMGLPEDPSERATFHFRPTVEYWKGGVKLDTTPRLDASGNPLDSSIRVRRINPAPVRIPVAVEFSTAAVDERPVGAFKPTKVTITIMDEYWPEVEDAIEVELGGDRYVISYSHPPMGLFNVTIYTIECFARSET